MSITALFSKLGAPLTNSRWSWGGVDSSQKRVFVRAWQDQTQPGPDGRRLVRLAHHSHYEADSSNAGYRERLAHLALLKEGHEGFVVMCKAKDPKGQPREIESFDARDVFRLGKIVHLDGDEWGEIVERVTVRSIPSR